jgi:hypothetical protein
VPVVDEEENAMKTDEPKPDNDENIEERDELDDLEPSEQEAEDVRGGKRANPLQGL